MGSDNFSPNVAGMNLFIPAFSGLPAVRRPISAHQQGGISMRGIGFYFFLAGALCVTIGMLWGIHMSASQNHTLAGAHAHLNLIGWVTMGLFGIYYTLTPHAAATMLAKVHLAVALLGVIIIVPGIVLAIQGTTEVLAILGSLLTVTSMVIFLITVFRQGLGAKA